MSRRLLLGYLSLTALVLLVLEVPLAITHARNERSSLSSKVERDAVAVASVADDVLEQSRPRIEPLRAFVEDYAARTGGRVVIVDDRGVALVDTEPPQAGTRSFASRPEIRAALSGRVASGVRTSQLLGTDLLYVAVPVASNGSVTGAVRITYPTSAVDERVRRYRLILLGIAVVVLAAATAVGLALARFVSRPLGDVQRAAAAAAAGDLTVRAREEEGPPEVRALAAEFNDMVGKLDGLLRAQREFVADASHQLRTPLTALRLRLENLEHDLGTDGQRELEAALAEVERLSRLVTGLLVLARADEGSGSPEEVDLTDVVRSRVDAWVPYAEELHIVLVARVPGTAKARATRERLDQVLDNLIENALEHSPTGATVTVSASGSELHVVDEGPGLSDAERERAFDRFWRGGQGDGSGLGLAIVRRLVEADGGRVVLRPATGGGIDAVVVLRGA
jgi:signal transduction histidine kinase